MRLKTIVMGVVLGSMAVAASAAPPSTVPTAAIAEAQFDAAIATAKTAMMADAEVALSRATAARDLALRMPAGPHATLSLATALWLQGEALINLNQSERAAPIIGQALAAVLRAAPGSKLHGDLLRSRGAVSAIGGRVQPALADFQKAHDIFQAAGERRSQAIILQDIGSIYLDAGDYDRVLRYYAQAAEVFDGDPNLLISAYNNQGNALRELKRYAEAEAEYRLALSVARKIRSPILLARILTNLAQAELLNGRLDAASTSLEQARAIANSDPAAAGWRPYISGVQAEIALRRGDTRGAAVLIAKTFEGVDLKTTNMSYHDFHEAAHEIYHKLGDDRLALAHLESFKRLDDEARMLAASTNGQLMTARFDFANQDLKIARLRTEKLQRDVELVQSSARFRTTILVGALSAAAIVLALLLIGYFSIRRSRNEVRAANDDLSLSNTALEKALKAKTEFLAMTSHEIRTPLNGILGMTQVILADRRIDGATRERLEVVRGAGEAMRGLVDDILDVAKMEKGKLLIEAVEMDLKQALSNAARLWSDQATSKNLTLTVDLDQCPARILADETRLRQIVSNLMSNAVKFTEAGSVTLKASAGASPDGAALLTITVSDTGIGIPTAAIDGIFESFRQVDAGTTRRFGGTGLGLAICRNLAEAMGGTIEVESVIDVGSCFRVVVPLIRLEDAAVPPLASGGGPAATLAESAVLVIERNPLTQSILRAVLAPQVARLEIASGAEAGLACLAGRFDQVLVDGGALGSEGADPVVTLLSLIEAAPDSLFTATWSDPEAALEARLLRMGVKQVIARPVSPTALLAALRTACEVHQAGDEKTIAA